LKLKILYSYVRLSQVPLPFSFWQFFYICTLDLLLAKFLYLSTSDNFWYFSSFTIVIRIGEVLLTRLCLYDRVLKNRQTWPTTRNNSSGTGIECSSRIQIRATERTLLSHNDRCFLYTLLVSSPSPFTP